MYDIVYSEIADKLVSDGYIIIEDVLDKEMVSSLGEYANAQNNFKKAGISANVDLHLDQDRRRDKILWIDEDNGVQSYFLDFTNGLKEYLNRSLYLGLRYYESHFAIYEKGDFYEKHLDAFKNSKNRIVTTVFYLNEDWDKDDGGELIIYDIDGNEITKVIPKSNTLVVFMSEDFPHEVLAAKTKRYSIAGWYRVD